MMEENRGRQTEEAHVQLHMLVFSFFFFFFNMYVLEYFPMEVVEAHIQFTAHLIWTCMFSSLFLDP